MCYWSVYICRPEASCSMGCDQGWYGKENIPWTGSKGIALPMQKPKDSKIPKSNLNFHVIKKVCVHACVLSRFSHVRHFATLGMVARQSPLPMGFLWARTLEWVAMPSSRGSSQPRDQTRVSCVSCIAGGFFTTEPPGKPIKKAYLKHTEGIGYII